MCLIFFLLVTSQGPYLIQLSNTVPNTCHLIGLNTVYISGIFDNQSLHDISKARQTANNIQKNIVNDVT